MGILLSALVLLYGCQQRAALPDPLGEAQRALAQARKHSAVALEAADRLAAGELLRARYAARAAGRPDLEARALNELGELKTRHDRFAEADSLFQQALEIAREGGDRAGQAAALNGTGDLLLLRGQDGEAAIALFGEALRLSQASGDLILQSKALYNLANASTAQNDLAQSRQYLEESLSLLDRNGKDPTGRRLTLMALGQLFLEGTTQAEVEQGRRILLDLLSESRAARDGNAEAHLEMVLGGDHSDRKDYESAARSFDRARELFLAAGRGYREGFACIQLASTNLYLGERDLATDLYERGLGLLQRKSRERGIALPYALASSFVFVGYHLQPNIGFEAARRDYYQPALRMIETAPKSPGLDILRAIVFHFYGRGLNAAGQHRQALRYLSACAPQLHETNKTHWARNRLELGKAYRALGQDQPAERELQGALEESRRLRDNLFEAVAHHEIARLERSRGQDLAAFAESSKTLRIIDEIRDKVESQTLRSSFFASVQTYYKFHLDLLMDLHRKFPAGQYDREALKVSERARARVLLDLLAEERIEITEAIPANLRERHRRLTQRITRLQSLFFRGEAETVEEELETAKRERQALEEEIRRQSPRYAEILHPVIRDIGEIQALLDADTALLEIALTESSVVLFVVTREGFQSFLPALTPERLERLVASLRQDILSKNDFLLSGNDNHALYRSLLGEAARGILRDKRNWLIAADGPLLLLSFETLLTRPPSGRLGHEQPYLIKEKTLHYIPSASVLAEIVARRSSPSPSRAVASLDLFALADPELAAPSKTFPPLAAAREEVEEIEALFPRGASAVYYGRQATRRVLLEDARFGTSRRIHFATHATLDESRPERSALLLADDRLTVSDIFNLRVQAELVVLSACNTGQGKQVEGEGLIGMTRAFFYAGAPTLVVSLWPADDRYTAKLMTSFYREMNVSRDKAEALRKAKLELVDEVGPYHWAPFILLGRSDGG